MDRFGARKGPPSSQSRLRVLWVLRSRRRIGLKGLAGWVNLGLLRDRDELIGG